MSTTADLAYFFKEPATFVEWMTQWKCRPVVAWIKGAQAFSAGEYMAAAQYYRAGLARNDKHRAAGCARMDLAYCLYRLGEFAEAEKLLLDIIGREVPREETYVLLAQIQSYLGRPLSALRTLAAGAHVFPDDVSILAEKLNISLSSGLNSRSLKKMATVLYSMKHSLSYEHPDCAIADTALSHYEIRCGDKDLGFRMLVRVLGSGRADAQTYLVNGEKLLEEGCILQAREQLSRAQRQCPLNPWPSFFLARSYMVNDSNFANPLFAAQLAIEACKLSKWENVRVLKVLQAAYDASGDLASAELIKARIGSLATARFSDEELYPERISTASQKLQPGLMSNAMKTSTATRSRIEK